MSLILIIVVLFLLFGGGGFTDTGRATMAAAVSAASSACSCCCLSSTLYLAAGIAAFNGPRRSPSEPEFPLSRSFCGHGEGRTAMKRLLALALLAGAALSLGGCVVVPAGPGFYGHPYGYGAPHYYRPHPYYGPY